MKQFQLVTLLALLSLAACSPKVDSRGYVQDVNWKDSVIVGQTTKDQVQEALGSPSAQSTFGPETWYYVSSRKETTAFLRPEVAEQDSVRIEFDAASVVSKIEAFDKDSSKEFALIKRTTPTEGHQLGFFEQVLGNVGRFNKSGGADSAAPGRKPSRH